jgi:hypothetical protein
MATSHATSVRSGTAAAAPAAPSTSTGSAAGLHHHTAPHQWLTASEAQLRLRCDAFTLGRLIAQGALHAYRAPAQGLIFRLDELDGTPVPLAAEDALPLLAGASPDPGDPSVMTTTQNPRGEPSDDNRPLKEAAVILDMPYKTLLRLASEGAIPAVDLNAHRGRQRPRFVVSISALRQHLKNQGDKQSAMRRARQPGIDLTRLAQPRGGGR